MIVGGASATAVTAHHQSVADGVRADAETWWYGEKFAEYVVVAVVEQTVAVGLLSLDEFTHEVYSVGRSGCSSVELGDKWPCASVYAWACDTHNWWRFPVVGTVARGWG